MQNYNVVSEAKLTLKHTIKLAALLETKGFDPEVETAEHNPLTFLIDVCPNTYLAVTATEVELCHKTKLDNDFVVFRRFFAKDTFKPSQVVHAVIDLHSKLD